MKDGPWNYDGRLLLLHEILAGEDPKMVPFHLIPFWVQVHDLPFDYLSEGAGRILGNSASRYLDYDPKNSLKLWADQYMRIQVELDVRRPLKRNVKVRLHGEERALCKFRYERLQNFCYICGIMGHTDKYCEAHFHFPAEQIVRKWDDSIRVKPRDTQQLLAARSLGDSTVAADSQWRGRQLFHAVPRVTPPPQHSALTICQGASTMSTNHPPAYNATLPEEEADLMEVGEARKRRRARQHHPEEERTSKSPTKSGDVSGEHHMTE
ncbi:hypothetical protein LINGRAHAP2_LOCUS7227 [Linum grandiflorum]